MVLRDAATLSTFVCRLSSKLWLWATNGSHALPRQLRLWQLLDLTYISCKHMSGCVSRSERSALKRESFNVLLYHNNNYYYHYHYHYYYYYNYYYCYYYYYY